MLPGLTLTEYTDPLSAWAWGSEGKLRRLAWRFGEQLDWRRVMACLFEEHAPAPAEGMGSASEVWAEVSHHTAMPFRQGVRGQFDSSLPACRAVKAAELQGAGVGERVLRRLREAVFLDGCLLEGEDEVLAALGGVAGLRLDMLVADLGSEVVGRRLRADHREARAPAVAVRLLEEIGAGQGRARECVDGWCYSVPTVLVAGPLGGAVVPGWKPYEDYEDALRGVAAEPLAARPDPTPSEALAYFGSLSAVELEMLCGIGAVPPQAAIRIERVEPVFFSEAAARASGRLRKEVSA